MSGLFAAMSPSWVSTGSPGTMLAIRKITSVASSTISAAMTDGRRGSAACGGLLPIGLQASQVVSACRTAMMAPRRTEAGRTDVRDIGWIGRRDVMRLLGVGGAALAAGLPDARARGGREEHAGSRPRHQRFDHLRSGARGAVHAAADADGRVRVADHDDARRLPQREADARHRRGRARRTARAGASPCGRGRSSTAAIRSPSTT